jgi:hypothetical protein
MVTRRKHTISAMLPHWISCSLLLTPEKVQNPKTLRADLEAVVMLSAVDRTQNSHKYD